MSVFGIFRPLKPLLSGRWQVPAALLGAGTFALALYRLLPPERSLDMDRILADVSVLEAAGATTAAADAIASLLAANPAPEPAQQAVLHDRLADIIYRRELERGTPSRENALALLEHHAAAARLGVAPTAHHHVRAARAAEWLGNDTLAVSEYRAALEKQPDAETFRTGAQALVRLLAARPGGEAERQRLLDKLLADEGISIGYLWWALQESLQDALDESDVLRARLILAQHSPRLKTSDLKGYAEYLWAWVMLREGRPEEAEPLAQWVDEWLDSGGTAPADLAEFGFLPAMNRWLLGRIHLAQHRPQAALEAFQTAMALRPRPDLRVACLAGRAEALAALQRHEAAGEVLQGAAAEINAREGNVRPLLRRLQEAGLRITEGFDEAGEAAEAARYLTIALDMTPADDPARRITLLERLGTTFSAAAESAATPAERRGFRGKAGARREEAAELAQLEEARASNLLWQAAQDYDAAGQLNGVRRVLARFLRGRTEDPRLPRAWLLVGRAAEAAGNPEEACRWYQGVIDGYPKLVEAQQARLRTAMCFRKLRKPAEAERDLRALLESPDLAPDSLVFRDALLELVEFLYEQGRYGEAIGRLENFSQYYPDDPQRFRAAFLLANAYRRSAISLRDTQEGDPADGAERAALSHSRFREAAELYDALLRDLETVPALDETQRTYAELALRYQADCQFALNEPPALQRALESYQQVAARYERRPAALAAHVQMANAHLRLGQVAEAARAIEAARWLLPAISDEAFAQDVGGLNREGWDRYLAALADSELFRTAVAAAR